MFRCCVRGYTEGAESSYRDVLQCRARRSARVPKLRTECVRPPNSVPVQVRLQCRRVLRVDQEGGLCKQLSTVSEKILTAHCGPMMPAYPQEDDRTATLRTGHLRIVLGETQHRSHARCIVA